MYFKGSIDNCISNLSPGELKESIIEQGLQNATKTSRPRLVCNGLFGHFELAVFVEEELNLWENNKSQLLDKEYRKRLHRSF